MVIDFIDFERKLCRPVPWNNLFPKTILRFFDYIIRDYKLNSNDIRRFSHIANSVASML